MQKFGHQHTETKLDALQTYLEMYTNALKEKGFHLIYFDAFAGTGSVETRMQEASVEMNYPLLSEAELLVDQNAELLNPIIDGSAKRALGIRNPFDEYVFVEKEKGKVRELEKLKDDFPKLSNRIRIIHGDANDKIRLFCSEINWKESRCVVFLDPFGSQVDFATLQTLARTKAVDLWYLFPSFLSVFRQISKEGQQTPEQRASLVRILGTDKWQEKWIKTEIQLDLLGHQLVTTKRVETDEITQFMIQQMKDEFGGRVLDDWLPLGKDGAHWYSLLFAWANPSPKARLAAKFAEYVLARK